MAINFPSNPSDGDVFERYKYNGTKGIWEAISLVQPNTLENVGNVNISATPANNETLLYNSSSNTWDSSAIPASAITSGTFDIARIPTGSTSSTVPLGDHTHDGRYYTESEVDTFLSGKSDISHTHDDRYYTESEVITLLASLVPSGTISQYAGNAAPSGYLLCEGQNVSRTTYSSLFAAIGTAYGSGDGSTTFTLPNLKGRVPVGKDSGDGSFDVLGETGGAKTHTLTTAEMPSHTHIQNSHNHIQDAHGHTASTTPQVWSESTGSNNWELNYGGTTKLAFQRWSSLSTSVGTATATNQATTATNQNTGGGLAHNNLQPYIVVNYIIKT